LHGSNGSSEGGFSPLVGWPMFRAPGMRTVGSRRDG
jgi:hypothetical protein